MLELLTRDDDQWKEEGHEETETSAGCEGGQSSSGRIDIVKVRN